MFSRLACVLLLSLALGGCGTWDKKANTALNATYAAAQTVQKVTEPYIHIKCMEEATKCRDAADTVCQPLKDCQALREKFKKPIIGAMHSVAMGKIALQAKDQKKVMEWLATAQKLLAQGQALVKDLGIGDPATVAEGGK